jgi:hypothetical protein
VFNIPSAAFVAGFNTLQVKLTNLFSVSLGSNTGWTSLSYSLCVSPAGSAGTPTPVGTVPVTFTAVPSPGTATPTWTPTNTPTPIPHAASFTPTPDRDHDGDGYPNPCSGDHMKFHYGNGPYRGIHLKIYTLGFRLVCHREHLCTGQQNEEVEWDLRDDGGSRVCNGIYYVLSECQVDNHVYRNIKKILILR